MEQCSICKKNYLQEMGWLAQDLMTWLCGEQCCSKFNEENVDRDMQEQHEVEPDEPEFEYEYEEEEDGEEEDNEEDD